MKSFQQQHQVLFWLRKIKRKYLLQPSMEAHSSSIESYLYCPSAIFHLIKFNLFEYYHSHTAPAECFQSEREFLVLLLSCYSHPYAVNVFQLEENEKRRRNTEEKILAFFGLFAYK